MGRGGVALALLLYAVWAAAFIRRSAVTGFDGRTYWCLFDDAMISMRYAWNCAHGLGLAWNPGERVEGITNFLMTVLMIPFTALLSKPLAVLGVQVAGIGVMAGIALLTRRLAAFFAPGLDPALRPRYHLLCLAAVPAWYPLSFCALMGLESGLLALLLLGALVLAFGGEAAPRFSPLLALLLGLALLTRPDAALPVAIIMLYRAVTLASGGRRAWRVLGSELLIVILMAGGLTLFRWIYYGSPVPNTYRLKLGGFPLCLRIPQGLHYIAPLLAQLAPLLALAVSGAARRFTRRKLLVLALAAALLAYPAWIGGDPLPHWRLAVPAFPLLIVLGLAEVLALAGRFTRAAREPIAAAGSLGALATLLILLAANATCLRAIALIESPAEVTKAQQNVDTALAILELTRPSATIAVSWAGIVPYYTGRPAIDLLGKSDPRIAALPPDLSGACGWGGFKSVPGHNKYDLAYSIVERRPTYAEVFTWGRQDVRDFARANYAALRYKGVTISLLRGSPDVHWEKLKPLPVASSQLH